MRATAASETKADRAGFPPSGLSLNEDWPILILGTKAKRRRRLSACADGEEVLTLLYTRLEYV